jgi:hypothetical protein
LHLLGGFGQETHIRALKKVPATGQRVGRAGTDPGIVIWVCGAHETGNDRPITVAKKKASTTRDRGFRFIVITH